MWSLSVHSTGTAGRDGWKGTEHPSPYHEAVRSLVASKNGNGRLTPDSFSGWFLKWVVCKPPWVTLKPQWGWFPNFWVTLKQQWGRCPDLTESHWNIDYVGFQTSVSYSVRRLLVRASGVPSSPILVTLMKEALSSSETPVLTRTTRRNIPEDAILQKWGRFRNLSESHWNDLGCTVWVSLSCSYESYHLMGYSAV
jgi:hypothetical protein